MMSAIRIVITATVGAVLLALGFTGPASAQSCAAMRASLVEMDRASVKPPGYGALRQLLLAHALTCRDVAPRTPGSAEAACAGSPSRDWCILEHQVAESCRTPQPESQTVCRMLFGEGYANAAATGQQPVLPIPPTQIALDGRTYSVAPECADILFRESGTAAHEGLRAGLRSQQMVTMRQLCPDFLAALERRTGNNAANDAARFWTALGDLVLSNFAARNAPPINVASINASPRFKQMCATARANENTCRARQGNMGEVGRNSRGVSGQAGAFGECAALYGSLARMCSNTEQAAARATQPPTTPPAPQPAAAPPPVAAAPPAANPGQSAPPPSPQALRQATAIGQLSPQCQDQLNNLLEATNAGERQRAANAYTALRGASCDVQMREVASATSLGLPERRMSARANDTMSRAMGADPNAALAGAANRNAQGAGGGGGGGGDFEIDQVINFGMALLGVMSAFSGQSFGGVSFGMINAGTNFSTMNQRAASTYGQGSPNASGYRPPAPAKPCGRVVCTAR
jgi:hypothetical protein